MRHFCASFLIAAGLNPKQVAAWLGNKTVAVIENTYVHLFRRTRRGTTPAEALRALDLGLSGVPTG